MVVNLVDRGDSNYVSCDVFYDLLDTYPDHPVIRSRFLHQKNQGKICSIDVSHGIGEAGNGIESFQYRCCILAE